MNNLKSGISFFIIICFFLLYCSESGLAGTTRINSNTEGYENNDSSFSPSISADGRYVVFHSFADDLVADDTNNKADIFVYDTVEDVTILVSIHSDGALGNGNSFCPSISADGRYVAFYSYANNLTYNDFNNQSDVFVHDTATGSTQLVSKYSKAISRRGRKLVISERGNGKSLNPSISANGRYVAYVSSSDNLVDKDTNDLRDIFVYDLVGKTTKRVSVHENRTQGNGRSGCPTISADGQYVAFYSYADNLVDDDSNGLVDIFVHDTTLGTTTRIHSNIEEAEGNGESVNPTISADGRYVAFYSYANNLVKNDTNGVADVFVYDRDEAHNICVSNGTDGTQGDIEDFAAAISANGRFVAFISQAESLQKEVDSKADVFLYDIELETTTQVSAHSDGTSGNGSSLYPAISSDGRRVTFDSYADNLVDDDTNNQTDIFLYDVPDKSETPGVAINERTGKAYDTIRAAVRAAVSGDTITVTDGIYVENVVINKPLTIQSENGMYETFIQSSNPRKHAVIIKKTSNVVLDGFSIYGGRAGVYLKNTNTCTIINNRFGYSEKHANSIGIMLFNTKNSLLQDNICKWNVKNGIMLYKSNLNRVDDNTCSYTNIGIKLLISHNNTITSNRCDENRTGIYLYLSRKNNMNENTGSNNRYGIRLKRSNKNTLSENTF